MFDEAIAVEIRLECLRLAASRVNEPLAEVISLAARMAAFVLGEQETLSVPTNA